MIAGSFASTFIKVALQLGSARLYVSLDTFPWCPLLRCCCCWCERLFTPAAANRCPLLRCYWTWRDLCHNCEV